ELPYTNEPFSLSLPSERIKRISLGAISAAFENSPSDAGRSSDSRDATRKLLLRCGSEVTAATARPVLSGPAYPAAMTSGILLNSYVFAGHNLRMAGT